MADQELSAEDLREKLFHTFRNRGVIDSLKSQLRNRLVTELQQSAKINLANGRKKPPEQLSLFHQAANSLVVNHLEKCNLEYTLSVFLPESATPKDKLLTIKDILHLLKISPESPLYKSLDSSLSSKNSVKSFLWEFISQISQLSPYSKQAVAIQTEDGSFTKSSIDEKLRSVDRAFSERAERENEAWSSQAEQKIAAFQKQCEERKKAELESEIQRFQTTELARMRLEEREKYQKELAMAKNQLEKDYVMKAEVLRVKEKETMERLQRQQQMQEEEAYAQRQKILDEMQAVRERENEFKRRQELNIKSVQLEEERVKTEVEKVKHLQTSLIEQEARHQQKIDDEVQRSKLQFQEALQKRTHDLELREAQFQQDKESFDRSKSTYMGYFDQLEGRKEELRQMQNQLEKERYATASITQQKETLQQKLDEVKDYRGVKDREQSLQKEVESLQRQVEDLTAKDQASKKSIKELTDKLSKPTPEMISLHGEVKALKEDAKNKEKLSKERQKKLETMLQTVSQRCHEYQRLYEEQLLRHKEMEREVEDLSAALQHTQTVLRMELERRRMSEASVSDLQDLATPSTLAVPPATPSITHAQSSRGHAEPDDDVMNGTVDMIAHSKDVYDKLEKEARELEESFRQFQSRMKNTGQFTMVPALSVNTGVRYQPTDTSAVPPSITIRPINNRTDTQHNFVPLSWVPSTEYKSDQPSYDPTIPQSYLGHTRPFTAEDKINGTRFYTLPSFGVSHVTQNTSEDRFSSLPRDARRPNNTVNVSDLFAKPGSPSVISAPIDHSPHDNSSKDTLKTHRATNRPGDSSTDGSRRPLSSTIDREKEGSGGGSRDTDIMTSLSAQRISGNVFVPSHGGVILEKSESEGDLNDSDSRRSSDISLSAGALSVGTLNKPAGKNNTWKTGRVTEELGQNVTIGNVSGGSSQLTDQTNRGSLDSVWGKPKDDSVFLKSQTAIQDDSAGQGSQLSLDSNWGKDNTGSVFLTSQTAINDTIAGGHGTQASLDSAWGKPQDDGVFIKDKPQSSFSNGNKERARPPVSLGSTWGRGKDDSVFTREKDGEELREEESSASFQSDPSLPGMGDGRGLAASLDNAWKGSTRSNDSENERIERENREREEREWEEERRKREELRRQREQEAREREQRELRELQREEEERAERERAEQERAEHERETKARNKEEKPERVEREPESKEPDIDPVMLQYMQMIQKRKEEGDKRDEVQVSKKRTSSKESINAPSNSEHSQGDENLGSIEEISGDEGFDWG